jgi:hypothetical protein
VGAGGRDHSMIESLKFWIRGVKVKPNELREDAETLVV